MTDPWRKRSGFLLAGLALAAGGAMVTSTSPFPHGSLSVLVVAVSVFLPFAVAAELRARYPRRTLAWLLAGVGLAYFVRSLAAINSPASYAPARAIGQISEVLLVWLMLAFPSGLLPRPWSLRLVVAGAAFVALLWLPLVTISPQIPARGVFVPCGAHCPNNDLLIANLPGASQTLYTFFRIVGAALLLATALILASRLKHASRVMRQVLAPVLLAAILRAVLFSAFVGLGNPALIQGPAVASYLLIPLAIGIGLMRGRAYDAAALERLVRGLRTRPRPVELQAMMATALDDPTLEIAYWLPGAQSYASADGTPVSMPTSEPARTVTKIRGAAGQPVASLTHDAALLDHPGLLDALSSTAAVALETNQLEAEVAAGRAGTVTAVDAERRRIERDLHDGTQQRLIALRMKVSAAESILGSDVRATPVLHELRSDIDSVLEELRALSHGIAPPILVDFGLKDALLDVANNAPLRVTVHAPEHTGYEPHVETAVYFCCLEALQNVAKHAGEGATADIDISCDGKALSFAVRDDGTGFDPDTVGAGAGLRNIRARVEELGGSATIGQCVGGGTEVQGSIPVAA